MSENKTVPSQEYLFTEDEKDEQDIVLEDMARGAVVTEADPTRSTLHYGSDEDGEGAVPSAPGAGADATSSSDQTDIQGPAATEKDATAADATQEAASTFVLPLADQFPPEVLADESTRFDISDSRFEVSGGVLRLKDGASADTSDPPQVHVTAVTTDGDSVSRTFEFDAPAANHAPEAVTLSNVSVAENAPGAIVGTLSAMDPDALDTHTFEVSDDRFEIVGGQLRLREDVTLDHEDAAEIQVSITATDPEGASVTQVFSIDVLDVNEGPSAASLSKTTLPENEAGATVGTISVVDPDAEDIHTFQVSDDRFEVVDGVLKLRDDVALDHETVAGIDVEVTITDSGGATLTESFAIEVQDVNEGPSSVSMERPAGLPQDDLVFHFDGSDLNGDGRLDGVDGHVTTWDDASSNAHTASATGPGDLAVDNGAVDFSGSSGDMGVRNSQDINSSTFTEKTFALSITTGDSVDGFQMVYEQGGTVRGYSVSIAPDPETGEPSLYAFAFNRAEWEPGDHFKAIKLGEVEPGETYDIVMVHDATADDIAERTLTGYLNGDAIETLPRVDMQHGHPGDVIIGNNGSTIHPTTFKGTGKAAPFEGQVHDLASWNTALSDDQVAQTFDYLSPELPPLTENAEGAGVGTLSVVDPDAGDIHTYEVSDDRFEVVEGLLKLRDGVSLDHEEAAQIEVEVTVTDSGGATLSESFVVNVQDVNEGPEAILISNGAVAVGASGSTVGQITVVDPDAGDAHSFAVSDDRFEVVDGQLKLRDDVALDQDSAGNIEVSITATDASGAVLTQDFTFEAVAVPTPDVHSGFHTRYFDVDHSLATLDDIDWTADPTHQDIKADINYANGRGSFWDGGSKDTFGVQVNGNIEVSESGTFQFHLGGDDGAVLFINGSPVIDNDGLHGFRTRSGEIELDPGTHHIEVRYFENSGSAGLKLEWEGPGIDGRELVTAPDVSDAQTLSGVPVALDVSLGGAPLPDGSVLRLDGLPEGTTVTAGDDSATVGPDGNLDISGWDTDVLTITPPVDFIGSIAAEVAVEVYTGNGTARSSEAIVIEVGEADVSAPVVEMIGGFQASYFDVDHRLGTLDDIDWDAPPTHQEMVSDINYENSRESFWEDGSKDTFGARLEGQITVEDGGSYTFFVGGDDGVMLYINGAPLIDNDGRHGYRTRQGEIELEPGTYDIEVRYFENTGHAGLRLEWDGPDTDGRELVQADLDTSVAENGTLAVSLDTHGASDDASIMLEGFPPDTIVISGEDSAVSDGGPVDVSGWNLDLVEISPPPGFEGVIDGQITLTDTAFNGAETRSISDFTLSVGDVDSPQSSNESFDETMLHAEESGGADTAGWDADETEPDDPDSDGDVMSERTEPTSGSEPADMNTETYERVEW